LAGKRKGSLGGGEYAFTGASFVVSPQGALLCQSKKIEEQGLSFYLDEAAITRARIELPLLRDENLKWTLNQLQKLKQI
jgi:predicted amidohydrolase